jgi:hypothetical protein
MVTAVSNGTAEVTAVSGAVSASAAVSVDTSAPTPFFSDNFDTGVKTNANGFTWDGAMPVGSGQAFSGQYALQFTFGPDAPQEDSFSEERFNLGRYLSEYWVDYMLFVPANFLHRIESGFPGNNKFFMTWRDTYSDTDGGTWRIGYEFNQPWPTSESASLLRPMSSRWDLNSWTDHLLDHPDIGKAFIAGAGPVQPGQWTRIRLQFRAASSRADADGIMRMWVNDALFAEMTTGKFHNFYDTPADAVLRKGYFLGWSNSGYAEETTFFIDDVKFYDRDPGWSP